jgi:hypothetical protein
MGGERTETVYPSIRKLDRQKKSVCEVRRAARLDQDALEQPCSRATPAMITAARLLHATCSVQLLPFLEARHVRNLITLQNEVSLRQKRHKTSGANFPFTFFKLSPKLTH